MLRNFNDHKAPGENGLTADALKALAQNVSAKRIDEPHAGPIRILLRILRKIWNGEEVPSEWHSGCLSPIFKKGDPLNPANWRPVCLLDISYKIMAAIIAARMNPIVRDDGLEEACGCLQKRGCVDAVCNLKAALQTRREHGHET